MKLKIRYFLIPLLIILGLFTGLTMINNKEENLNCDMAAATMLEEGKPLVKLFIEYKWSKMPLRLSPDALTIHWDDGWIISKLSIKINGINVTDKFDINLYNKRNELVLHLNSNTNFLSKETFSGEVDLVPYDISKTGNKFYSSSDIQYVHKGIFNIVKCSSIGWENEIKYPGNN